MTRSRRSTGKATTKELQKDIGEMQTVINQLINAMTNDMSRLNGIVYAMLQEDGRFKESKCPSCSQVLFEPQLKLLPPSTSCPACGASLDDSEQMSIDDWDNGVVGEEE